MLSFNVLLSSFSFMQIFHTSIRKHLPISTFNFRVFIKQCDTKHLPHDQTNQYFFIESLQIIIETNKKMYLLFITL